MLIYKKERRLRGDENEEKKEKRKHIYIYIYMLQYFFSLLPPNSLEKSM